MSAPKDSDQLVEPEPLLNSDEDIIELSSEDELPPDDDIIELTDVVPEVPADEPSAIEQADSLIDSLGIPLETESGLPDMDELHPPEDPGAESTVDENQTSGLSSAESPLSVAQIERLMERVVQRLIADKLDSILVQVIEKAVTKEIDTVKRLLLKEIKDLSEDNFF